MTRVFRTLIRWVGLEMPAKLTPGQSSCKEVVVKNTCKVRPAAILYALVLLVLPAIAAADQLHPILDISGTGVGTVPLADAVGGWQFHLSSPLKISAIGLWDENSAPLSIAHDVGLWTISETMLAEATVDNSSIPVASSSSAGQWLFTVITPITLEPGDYVLGAVWGDPIIGADIFRFGERIVTSYGVNYEGPRETTLLSEPILVFPDSGGLPNGIFGPNLAVTAVPEPISFVLLGTGILGFAAVRRRKAKL